MRIRLFTLVLLLECALGCAAVVPCASSSIEEEWKRVLLQEKANLEKLVGSLELELRHKQVPSAPTAPQPEPPSSGLLGRLFPQPKPPEPPKAP